MSREKQRQGQAHGRKAFMLVTARGDRRGPRRNGRRAAVRIGGAQAADKMTRAQAEYQDMPNGLFSCGMCSLFEAPNGCKVVEGEVSRDGWCKAFALQD